MLVRQLLRIGVRWS